MLHDGGEKVDAADKGDVETALADAKTTLSGDPGKTELDAARERLTTASHKLAEALYKANAATASAPTDGDAAAAGTADQPKQDEGVIDAEYVDTEK
jgi:molecular chaperone DnaK